MTERYCGICGTRLSNSELGICDNCKSAMSLGDLI